MSRRSCQRVKVLLQKGKSLADAKAEARTSKRRAPFAMVDGVTGKRVATLSVRKSRARKQSRYFGADARLVRQ